MVGFWYITFGCIALVIISGALWIVADKLYKKYCGIYRNNKFLRNPTITDKDIDRAGRLAVSWKSWSFGGEMAVVISCVLLWIFLFISVVGSAIAKYEAAHFKQQKEYVEMVIENGTELENLAISHTIIEQNMWLAEAKASLEMFGQFSKYYVTNVDELEPIIIIKR